MPSKKDGIALLKAVPMFSEVSQRDLGRVWSFVKIVEHGDGSRIVDEDRLGVGFHLIIEGNVEVVRTGRRLTLGPGDFFGEVSLIDGGPRTATVIAKGPVTVAALSAWEFKSIVKESPEMMWKLLLHMTRRLREEQSAVAGLTA